MTIPECNTDHVCRLCGGPVTPITKLLILGRHRVDLQKCSLCEFVQTQYPWWLDEAYSDAINRFDTGAVDRIFRLSFATAAIINVLFPRHGRFLDYGGGHGIFTRRMRDLGLDFRWQDKYCENLYAKGYEGGLNSAQYDLITAFEVFEHLVEPQFEIKKLLEAGSAVLFSTQILQPQQNINKWDYLATEHGQHIAFYSIESLERFAHESGFNFVSDGRGLHLFSKKRIPRWLFVALTRRKLGTLLRPILCRKSLTLIDHNNQKLVLN